MAAAVQEEFTGSGGTYGSPKVWIRLIRQGWRVSVDTIATVMAELGLVARRVCHRRGLTRPGKRPAGPDFVRVPPPGGLAVSSSPGYSAGTERRLNRRHSPVRLSL
ncbi:transposase [Streptomyces sp. NPDC019443]|uniref:transposase n=1 Tax=Streptomyces sp. NPDC019443 TaxID=3365061 RepID=UPI00379EFC25